MICTKNVEAKNNATNLYLNEYKDKYIYINEM